MALALAVPASISQQPAKSTRVNSRPIPALLWAGLLTAVVAGPWLLPGFVFGTDWPGPRRIDFPISVFSAAPLEALIAAVSYAIGSEAAGKVLIVISLFTAAFLAYRSVQPVGFVAGAAASTVYVINPFVYGRLHYGQLYLVAGYAVLPWVAVRLRRLLVDPRVRTALAAAASLVLLGVLSLHLFLISGLLFGALSVAHVMWARERRRYVMRFVPQLLLTGIAALSASAWWIVPLLTARGPEGSKLAGISNGDLNAFAVIPDEHVGLVPNLLGLYGFWAEESGRFTSMKAFVPAWPLVLSLLLILCVVGVLAALRKGDEHLTPWVVGLLGAAIVALVLEMGVSNPMTAGLVQWLDSPIPLYRGMRDAGKWAALLALVYSQLAALGVVAVLAWLKRLAPAPARSEWITSIAAGLLLALPLYYGNGLLYGAHGEIKPSPYPAGWYAADHVLAADPHPDRTLFLPWHQYMSYSFIQNQNNVVAPPAPTFFSVPVLVSLNAEVPGIAVPTDPDQIAISKLVGDGAKGQWAAVLTKLKIKYVLLAREVDYASFWYLDYLPDFAKIGDFGSIVLYRVILPGPRGQSRGP